LYFIENWMRLETLVTLPRRRVPFFASSLSLVHGVDGRLHAQVNVMACSEIDARRHQAKPHKRNKCV
jgi:hypothetical protein